MRALGAMMRARRAIGSSMRALYLVRHGGPDSFEIRQSADPEPAPGQVRVRVKAAGLNFSDLLASQGLYPDAPRPPAILGYEASGVVDAVGDGVDGSLVGRRVMATSKFGAHTDTLCVAAELVMAIPDSMSFEQAAAIAVVYVTAYHMLHRVACLQPGESILIHQAAGGVGIAALQLCGEVAGITTFGTASRAKHDVLRGLGCSHPIDYRSTDYAKELRRLNNGKGVDIVLDALGGADWRKGYDLLNPCGRLVCFGFANLTMGKRRNLLNVVRKLVSVPKFNPLRLMSENRSVAGVNMAHFDFAADMFRNDLRAIIGLFEKGLVQPLIDTVAPFSEMATALGRLRDGKNIGKVVLVP